MNQHSLSGIKTALYRKPKDELLRLSRWGPRAYFQCDAWAAMMESSVARLSPPIFDPSLPSIEASFLTGKKFWYQTVYCAWTLSAQSNREVVLNLVDDGTLSELLVSEIRRLFPRGALRRRQAVEKTLDRLLPRDSFPVLRQRCDDYINIRKFVDVHLDSQGWKLVLDSDMLFFSRPDELMEWWNAARQNDPETPVFLMKDCEESYGYSRTLMTRLSGTEIPPLLNVGVCGLRSEDIDWDEIENWCFTLQEEEGTSYYLEQALVAMMASVRSHRVLPADSYLVFPERRDTLEGNGVLQHYVADSKPWYFEHAWKKALELAPHSIPLRS